MYSFDGQHKAGLKVSLGGASKQVNKSALLQSAREERYKREATRKQNVAAIRLQSWFRGCWIRNLLANHQRAEFESLLKSVSANKDITDYSSLKHLVQQITLFYKFNEDYQRLVSLCQIILKITSSKKLHSLFSTDSSGWTHRIKNVLVLCCRSLHGSTEINITIPLRMLEVFTEAHTYSWMEENLAISTSTSITIFLVLQGYFHHLRELINRRVPSSIEPSTTPPTPFAAAARDLVLKPVLLLHKSDGIISNENIRLVQSTFIKDLLSQTMSEQICFFLIPSLSMKVPFSSFLQSVMESKDQHTVWTLYSFLLICQSQLGNASAEELQYFVSCLRMLVKSLEIKKESISSPTAYDSDSDDSDMEVDMEGEIKIHENACLTYVKEKCLEIINEKNITSALLLSLDQSFSNTDHASTHIHDVCDICYHLLMTLRLPIHKSRLLYTIAFNGRLMRSCWYEIKRLKTKTITTGKDVKLMEKLMYGHILSRDEESCIIPMLSTFTLLFRYALFSIYDIDFYGENTAGVSSMMPFSLNEIIEMSHILRDIVVGLISYIYPDLKSNQSQAGNKWLSLCQHTTQLVKQLYARDSRHRFCPDEHWLSGRAAISQENMNISSFLDEEDEVNETNIIKPGVSTINARSLAILKYIPFAVPFMQRIRIFQRILSEDVKRSRDIEQTVLPSHGMNITVNRKYLYQDAYDQLSEERAPDVRKVIRVQMINAQGLDEAGVDGGGVFREFMSQLLKTGFDPSYGFFKLTSQQLLYPNPDIGRIQDNYIKHLHFLGRMLGKIIYESMMVELPLADFFLCKLLNKHGSDLDIYHLESLDPQLYKFLPPGWVVEYVLHLYEFYRHHMVCMYLYEFCRHHKNYDGDVDDLSLNFTVIESGYGETMVEELKPGGKDICVTNSNRIEYIHLMADYRLNKQIRAHCNAFRAGLSDVINIEWLQMFDHRELQILISGAPVPIDIDDLRANTNYSGSYKADDSYIIEFWNILSTLTDKQKRQFLKFVTSCSRPPLLGFSELYPQFCIHFGGNEDRLPTASTCMNFLKLPKYENTELLKTRLIYAVEAESGFELS